nr:MAG TPA: hypothetical protein [Caudoviricetes sp.]
MKFAFKNPELEKWIYECFDDASVQAQIERQWEDGTTFITISASEGHDCFCESSNGVMALKITLNFPKKALIKKAEYAPDQWNPYPEVTPPSEGWYLVTLEDPECGEKVKVEADWYHPSSDNWGLNARQRIRAFKAFPKPYEEEKSK